jgi:mannose-6-phosphate isomerase-like protein (cupin superfamily)
MAMAEQTKVIKGEGYAIAPDLEALGEGYGFRKLRKELDVTAFGVNAITMPPSYESGEHYHDEQEELYFVHRGTLVMGFGDGSEHELREGGAARVDAATVRRTRNPSDSDDVVYLVVGGKGGYVGRDGREPEGEGSARGPLG